MPIVFQESITVSTEPSPIEGLVIAEYVSPSERFSTIVEPSVLEAAQSIDEARTAILRHGYYALSASGFDKLDAVDHERYLAEDDLLDPVDARRELLVRDARGEDGFVYRYGHDTPRSTPLPTSVCAASTRMTPELLSALREHPWVTADERTHFVPGNGESLDLWIRLPQSEFDRLYRLTLLTPDRYRSSSRIVERILPVHGGEKDPEFDVLDVHRLLERGSGFFD